MLEGLGLLGPIDATSRIAASMNGVEAWTEIMLQQKHIRTRGFNSERKNLGCSSGNVKNPSGALRTR